MALKSSPHYMCLQSFLQAEFGYCIKYANGNLPEFSLQNVSANVLTEEHKILVLPYFLDQSNDDGQWGHFIYRLVELGRFDLLNQITFAKITSNCFYELMSVAVPEFLLVAAAKSLQKNKPTSKLLSLLAFAGFGSKPISPPEKCDAPYSF